MKAFAKGSVEARGFEASTAAELESVCELARTRDALAALRRPLEAVPGAGGASRSN